MTLVQMRARECVAALNADREANLFRGLMDSAICGFEAISFTPTLDAAAVAIIERAIEAILEDYAD